MELSVGPQTTLVGGEGDTERFTLKCVTEEGEQLNAIIVTHSKCWYWENVSSMSL